MNETAENEEYMDVDGYSSLERIDRKYIWGEISSVLTLDKGIFYTIKALLIRPGQAVREFLLLDRKRLVKPIVFVVFSAIFYLVCQQLFQFKTNAAPENVDSASFQMVSDWVLEHYSIASVLLGIFMGLWIRLFFLKSKFNLFEVFVLVFYIIGMLNIFATFFGILESIVGLDSDDWTYYVYLSYSVWAIGSFFNRKKIWSYFRGLLAYVFGATTHFFLLVLIAWIIELAKNSN